MKEKHLQNENRPGHNCFEINNNNKAEQLTRLKKVWDRIQFFYI